MHKINSSNEIDIRTREAVVDKKLTTTDITASGMVSANSMITNFLDATDIYTTNYLGQRVKLLTSNTYAVPIDLSLNSINLFNSYDPTSSISMDYNDITLSNETSELKLTADGLYLGNNFIDENRILLWESKLDYAVDHPADLFNIYSGTKKLMFNVDGIADNTTANFKFSNYPPRFNDLSASWVYEPLRVTGGTLDVVTAKYMEIDALRERISFGNSTTGLFSKSLAIGINNNYQGIGEYLRVFGNNNILKSGGTFDSVTLKGGAKSIIIGDSNTIHDEKNIVIGDGYTVKGNTTCIGYPETTKCFINGIRNKSYDYTIPDINGVCLDTITNQLGIYDRNKFKNEINIYGNDTSLCKITGGKISLFNAGGNNAIHIEPTVITIDNEIITKDRIIKWDNFADTAVSDFSDTIFRISNDSHTNQLRFDLSGLTTANDYKLKVFNHYINEGTNYVNWNQGYTLPYICYAKRVSDNAEIKRLILGNEVEKFIEIYSLAGRILVGSENTTNGSLLNGVMVGYKNYLYSTNANNITIGNYNNIGTGSSNNIIIGNYNKKGVTALFDNATVIGNCNIYGAPTTNKCFIYGINGNTDQLATGVGIDPTSNQLKVFNRHEFNGPITIESQTLSGSDTRLIKSMNTMKLVYNFSHLLNIAPLPPGSAKYAVIDSLDGFIVNYNLSDANRVISGSPKGFRFVIAKPWYGGNFHVTCDLQYRNKTIDVKKLFARVTRAADSLSIWNDIPYAEFEFQLETTETTYVDYDGLKIVFNIHLCHSWTATTTTIN